MAAGVLGSDLASAPAAMTPELVKSVGQAVSRGPAKAVVAWLASTIGRSMLLARIQSGLVAVCLTVAGIGCVWLFVSQRQGSGPVAKPARGIAVSTAKPVDAPAGVDFFGDPLPHGAVARLGTVRFNHGTTIEQVAYSPDGRFLASLGVDGVVRLWNSSTGCEIRQVGPSDERFASMSFQPDGKTMNLEIRQFWDGRVPKVMQIDVDSGPETRLPSLPPAAPSLPGLPSPFDLDVPEPESGPSAIEGIQERFVPLFEGFPNALRRQLVVKGQEQECYVESRDGLQWAMSDGTSIRLFDMKTGVERWKVAAGIITRQLMFSYDGSMLASAGTIRPVQMADLKEPIEHPSPPTSSVDLARHIHSLSPRRLAAISVWDVATGRLTRQLAGHPGGVTDLVFSPDGKTIASSGRYENAIRVWNMTDGSDRFAEDSPQTPMSRIAISPDGETLVMGDALGTVRGWNRAAVRPPRHIGEHEFGVSGACFAPDGKEVLTCGFDMMCRWWDVATGRQIRCCQINALANRVSVSPDGQSVIAGNCILEFRTGELAVSLL